MEAQTLANVYLALENELEIIPVLNKIDLPGADPERVKREIEEVVGLDCSNAIMASAKMGIGIDDILEAVVQRIPPPADNVKSDELRALIFDSYYDPYKVGAQWPTLHDRPIAGSPDTLDSVFIDHTSCRSSRSTHRAWWSTFESSTAACARATPSSS